jgi:translation initiation factor 2B subunit (eIF-2B alpha/beta/delta family)
MTALQPWVATLSASGAVREALLLAQAEKRMPRALVAEGRPHCEGRGLAASLGEAGIPTWLVVDAALPMLLSQATLVWIGADAVTDRGVINKAGSLAAALAAREHSVPVYAVAMRRKFLPASTAALRIEEMPPEEVWSEAPETVKPRNVYFELVPLELFRGIVVEDGVLGIGEAAVLARERPLPAELAAEPGR